MSKLLVTTRGQGIANEKVGHIEVPPGGFADDDDRARAVCDVLPKFIDFYAARFRWSRQGALCQAAKDCAKALRGLDSGRDYPLENKILQMYLHGLMITGRQV